MEGKSVSSSGLEWEDLALYGKPIEIHEQSSFSLSNAFGLNDLGNTSSSSNYPISHSHQSNKDSRDWFKDGSLCPYDTNFNDTFRMQRFEPNIGLKLGIPRENGDSLFPTTSSKYSVSSLPVSSFPVKRTRNSYHNSQNPSCQVEGCNLDLTSAKDYHRRHRICENHSKSPKVIVAGMERRFCQQCSRFHELSEFDDKKRSCRRRLSDHNARRRRVQPESLQLTSPGLSSSFYDHRMQQSLLLNGIPISQAGPLDETMCFSNDAINSLQLDPTRNLLNHGLHVPKTNSPMDTDLLSAHSLLSWSLNESESSTVSYISTIREMNSESNLFHHNNAPPPPLPQMDYFNEYELFCEPYEQGSFYPGHRDW